MLIKLPSKSAGGAFHKVDFRAIYSFNSIAVFASEYRVLDPIDVSLWVICGDEFVMRSPHECSFDAGAETALDSRTSRN